MSELDLLNLARSATEHEVTWFAEVITINFGMVVAIYYFLSGARLPLKAFAFFAYTTGMLVLLGQMLLESNVKVAVMEALNALPVEQLSGPTIRYLAVNHSWLSAVTRITFNLSFWILLLGVFYLLFWWKKDPAQPLRG